jgi:hypothetical protein
MEDMLRSPLVPQPKPKTNTRQWRDRIRAEAWPDANRRGFHSAIRFECGDCVTESSPDERSDIRAVSRQEISYTDTLSAMPLNATRLGAGFSPLVSSSARACAFSTTDSVTTIEREAARPWTRDAMFTVWPK